jgi:saccharopine dehydrogenase-like NADP-dependent oxidoreductase
MHNVMMVGAGKIGVMIACLLSESGDYQIHLADNIFESSVVTLFVKKIPKY